MVCPPDQRLLQGHFNGCGVIYAPKQISRWECGAVILSVRWWATPSPLRHYDIPLCERVTNVGDLCRQSWQDLSGGLFFEVQEVRRVFKF